MNEERIQELLISFAENKISRADYDELMELIRQTRENEALHQAMDSVWRKLGHDNPVDQLQTSNIYDRIINDARFIQPDITINNRSGLFKLTWLRVAATVLLASTFSVLGYKLYTSSKQAVQITYLQYVVPAGHHAQFEFADGTVVAVNAGSKLKYPSTFTGKTREIFLEGEAYFKVAHDASRPFIVHTGTVRTQVLGTAFDIEAYGTKKLQVTVTSGKVSVLDGNNKLGLLTPNHKLAYNYQNKKAEEFTVNAIDAIGWKDGNLIFHDLTMQEATEILERWYNVKINADDIKASQSRFSVSFLKKESLKEVLNVLSRLNSFRYTVLSNGDVKIHQLK
ncbi:MAG: FecR family protein [Bacteroidota bacterium]